MRKESVKIYKVSSVAPTSNEGLEIVTKPWQTVKKVEEYKRRGPFSWTSADNTWESTLTIHLGPQQVVEARWLGFIKHGEKRRHIDRVEESGEVVRKLVHGGSYGEAVFDHEGVIISNLDEKYQHHAVILPEGSYAVMKRRGRRIKIVSPTAA